VVRGSRVAGVELPEREDSFRETGTADLRPTQEHKTKLVHFVKKLGEEAQNTLARQLRIAVPK
jgi:hypothetical protein